ncbi:hypothetical protein VdG2_02344 [Verticillium dahliae VDG2]|nr:hypothetical protein VdG2_02344 [Verticillium dahliae VDG2]
MNLLRWVAFGRRPLTVNEIATAITINADAKRITFIDEGLEVLDIEDFLDSSSSPVSVHVGPQRFREPGESGSSSWSLANEAVVNSILAHSCLAYFLQTTEHATDEYWDANPLAGYAGRFMMVHRQLSSDTWDDDETQALLADLFDEEKPYFHTWLRVTEVDRPCVKKMATTDAHEMTHNGYMGIVKIFLATNVDVNAIGGRYATAVATAAAQDHVEIMRELLTAGANITLQGRFDWLSGDRRTDPLFVAALNGSVEAVKVALEHGAVDYWRLKPYSGSALTAATLAWKGNAHGFMRLVELGADVHREDPDDETPLLRAAGRGGCIHIIEHYKTEYHSIPPTVHTQQLL